MVRRSPQEDALFSQIAQGRTDLVREYLSHGYKADYRDDKGRGLINYAAYYGDVTAVRALVLGGVPLSSLGPNFDLNRAAFHGHWRLCQFVLEQGADPNSRLKGTDETPLHAALCTRDRAAHDPVVQTLLKHGADPNARTVRGAITEGFMRDCRTKGETPLHRAAAFGDIQTVEMLLDAGADRELRDANGDSPLSWASWYLRPAPILRLL